MPDDPQTGNVDSGRKARMSVLAILCLVLASIPYVWILLVVPRLGLTWIRLDALHRTLALPLWAAASAGFVLGVVSHAKIRASRGALRGHTLAFVGMALGCLAFCMLFVYPGLERARESSRRVSCRNNVKQLGLAVLMYQWDNKEAMSATLQTLVDTGYVKDLSILTCDAVSKRTTRFDPRNVDATADYIYTPPANPKAAPDVPIIWENPKNHDAGGNVCFSDGHVVWIAREYMPETLEQSAAYYAAPPERLRALLAQTGAQPVSRSQAPQDSLGGDK